MRRGRRATGRRERLGADGTTRGGRTSCAEKRSIWRSHSRCLLRQCFRTCRRDGEPTHIFSAWMDGLMDAISPASAQAERGTRRGIAEGDTRVQCASGRRASHAPVAPSPDASTHGRENGPNGRVRKRAGPSGVPRRWRHTACGSRGTCSGSGSCPEVAHLPPSHRARSASQWAGRAAEAPNGGLWAVA
jgi:hypothetical protein